MCQKSILHINLSFNLLAANTMEHSIDGDGDDRALDEIGDLGFDMNSQFSQLSWPSTSSPIHTRSIFSQPDLTKPPTPAISVSSRAMAIEQPIPAATRSIAQPSLQRTTTTTNNTNGAAKAPAAAAAATSRTGSDPQVQKKTYKRTKLYIPVGKRFEKYRETNKWFISDLSAFMRLHCPSMTEAEQLALISHFNYDHDRILDHLEKSFGIHAVPRRLRESRKGSFVVSLHQLVRKVALDQKIKTFMKNRYGNESCVFKLPANANLTIGGLRDILNVRWYVLMDSIRTVCVADYKLQFFSTNQPSCQPSSDDALVRDEMTDGKLWFLWRGRTPPETSSAANRGAQVDGEANAMVMGASRILQEDEEESDVVDAEGDATANDSLVHSDANEMALLPMDFSHERSNDQ